MGLFSSKTVINTGVAISPLLQEKPNLVRDAILKASFNDLPYVPVIVDAIVNGYNIDPRAFYRYGDTGDYLLGLPNGHVPKVNVRTDAVKELIASFHPSVDASEINYQTLTYKTPSDDEVSRYLFQLKYNPDTITGYATEGYASLPDGYVFEYAYGYLTSRITDEYEDSTLTYYDSDYSLRDLFCKLTINIFDPDNREATLTQETITFPIKSDSEPSQFIADTLETWEEVVYVVQYQLPDGSGGLGVPLMFMYDIDVGTYPDLDVYDDDQLDSPYFPIVPIRIDQQMVGAEDHEISLYSSESELYDQADTLLGYVGLDMETLQTALEDNPDINDIDDCYVVFGMPFGSEHDGAIASSSKTKAEIKYLWKYLNYLKDEVQTVDKEAFLASEETAIANGTAPLFNVLHIRDSELITAIYWNYIDVEEVDYMAPFSTSQYRGRKSDWVYSLTGSLKEEPSAENDDFYCQSAMHVYYHDDTAQKSYKLVFHGVYIYQNVYSGKAVINTLWDSFIINADEPKDGFYLPLSWNILQTLNTREENEVAFGSLILVSYAIKKTKVKWYQRAAFLNLVRIVIFVIAVYTQNYQLLSLNVTASQLAYIIIESIVVTLASQAFLSVIFKALVDIIGVDAAVFLAVIATAVGALDGAELIDLAATMPTAVQMLELVSALSDAIVNSVNEKIQDIQSQLETLKSEAEEIQEEIDAANELLGDVGVDINTVIQKVMTAEYPDQFFLRTLSTDIGYTSLDTVDYFYDNALKLKLPSIVE